VTKRLVGKIAIEGINYENDILYSYIVSDELSEAFQIGKRVIVGFGRSNSKRRGLVLELSIEKSEDTKGLKSISAIIDDSPVISPEMVKVIKWMKDHYFCSYYEAFKLTFPEKIGRSFKGVKCSVNPDACTEVLSDEERNFFNRIAEEFSEDFSLEDLKKLKIKNFNKLIDLLTEKKVILQNFEIKNAARKKMVKLFKLSKNTNYSVLRLSEKQFKVCNFLEKHKEASKSEICGSLKITDSVIKSLLKKKIIIEFEADKIQENHVKFSDTLFKAALSPEQEKVFGTLLNECTKGEPIISLLHGVTGSGKTQVILKLIDYILKINKNAIFLVPEIALTLQFINLFTSRYKEKVAVIHSGISNSQKIESWEKIKNGEIKVVIGARSAVFAPFENLGIIVIDEEHEFTYKSEFSPRFDAREIAKYRCAYNKCLLVLSSATPSVESYYLAQQGKYVLCPLEQRYGNLSLPEVKIIDMNGRYSYDGELLFSEELLEAIREEIFKGKQVIILINRRGFNTFVKCTNCGEIQMCPYCSVSLSFHKSNNRLLCHYCGYSKNFSERCISCGEGRLLYLGFGTQKAEFQLKSLIPEAKVLRLDSDTKAKDENSKKEIIKSFEEGQYNVLIGTQMISKGFNFPKVSLTGILMIDQYLYSNDFKGSEKAFSLITQTVGRAGRKEAGGKAIIQTFTPESETLKLAASQDYKRFFAEELAMRRLMLNPPFADICVIMFRGKNEDIVYDVCCKFFVKLQKLVKSSYSELPLRILRPTPATIKKIAGDYRYKIVLKCKNTKKFRDMINNLLIDKSDFQTKRVTIIVDINPISIL